MYATSGKLTAAIIDDPKVIIDSKLFWIPVQSRKEAEYLTGILNTTAAYQATAPYMSQGLMGARDVHKHVWNLPIPSYDDKNPSHRNIAKLASKTMEKVQKELDRIGKRNAKFTLSRARTEARKIVSTCRPGRELEKEVTKLLTQE